MTDTQSVQSLLNLEFPPIAVGLFDEPPAGIARWTDGQVPAGCSFWREAQNGRVFYTVPEDHYNCAIGSYTHAIRLPMAREHELMDTVGFMVERDYISMEEVPSIPTLASTSPVVAYGPAESVPFEPTVIIVAAPPASAMLLYEAAIAAGASNAMMTVLGRPGCAVIPLCVDSKGVSISLGCQGNRIFTGLSKDLMYVCVSGDKWAAVGNKLAAVKTANDKMAAHYTAKKEALVA